MPALVFRVAKSSPELEAGLDRVRHDFDVPTAFPADVEAAADAAAKHAIAPGADRRDARDVPFVTIDPPGTRDLDQAYFAARQGDGFRVQYAIADVAAFVDRGDATDTEAFKRGVTRYLPDRRAPLYPDVVGEGAASLLADSDRPALLWTIDLHPDGSTVSWHVERAVVRNREALTYEQVQQSLGRGDASEPLQLLEVIGKVRQEQERARGGVSIAVPAQQIHADGNQYDLEYETPLPSEGWNAQISLLTGMCAASTMMDGGVGLLRTLPPPNDGTVARLKRTAAALGIAWPDGKSYADVVRDLVPDDPKIAAFLTQAVVLFRGAGYSIVEQKGGDAPVHGAINAPYAHVTAPLRRLADRFANEIVLALCAGREPPSWARDALPQLPEVMGQALRSDATIERAVVDLVESLVLTSHVGEVFHGAVVDVDQDRATIQIAEPAVIASLAPTGLTLGAEVAVRLTAATPEQRRVEFVLA